MAIGARAQSSRTYLERHLDEFSDSSKDKLIRHCLKALRDTLPNDVELTNKVSSLLFFYMTNHLFKGKIDVRILT